MNKFTSISVRLATPEDQHLTAFDNTKLVALDTCVRWGIITYQMHKTWSDNQKAQALEAGTVLHQVFAAVRLWQLCYFDLKSNLLAEQIIDKHGKRLFGKDRWEVLIKPQFFVPITRENLMQLCLTVLNTSNYVEDPEDKKRSMTALEEVAINYINRWDMTRYPIWIRDKDDPDTDVGIEIGFDLVIEFTFEDGSIKLYRFTGKLDGLHFDPDETNPDGTQGALFVEDNKTTSRIMSEYQYYDMDTQMRGYMLAARVFTEQSDINHAKVRISSVPVPAKSTHGGQYLHPVRQPDYMIERWFSWFYNLAQKEAEFKDNPFDAPESPHSCHRYFRNCSMLPFCTASKQEQEEALDSMIISEWNVLAEED